ncbi:hypothetical_protein_-_conserved [Leishmania major strain Friedlin]|nr:hypothetical_protein_-_conserved [Leishmania major strain Friedlin]
MLRDMFISEITVRVFDGLRESCSLDHLGMRYGDVPLLTARSLVPSSTVLHVFRATLTSVVALQHCTELEVVDVSACAQLADLGTLGLAPCLCEVDAAGSGVLHVSELSRSCSLERFLLAQCVLLNEVGPLGQCVDLRELRLTGTGAQQLEGLARAPSLHLLDISFCRQLASFTALLSLPRLRYLCMGGCTAAQRQMEEVMVVVAALTSRCNVVSVLRS